MNPKWVGFKTQYHYADEQGQEYDFQQIETDQALKILRALKYVQIQQTLEVSIQQAPKHGTLQELKEQQKALQTEILTLLKNQQIDSDSICRGFLSHECNGNCDFLHIRVCTEMEQGQCHKTSCEFLHPEQYGVVKCPKCTGYGHQQEDCHSF